MKNSYLQYLKKYKVTKKMETYGDYNYKAAHNAKIIPKKWNTLPKSDQRKDIEQAMQGLRTGRRMTREEALKFYKNRNMWPDKFKTRKHKILPEKHVGNLAKFPLKRMRILTRSYSPNFIIPSKSRINEIKAELKVIKKKLR